MLNDVKHHGDDKSGPQELNVGVTVVNGQDEPALPRYQENRDSYESRDLKVDRVAAADTYVSEATEEHDIEDGTNPFASPLDHPAHGSQSSPRDSAPEKDSLSGQAVMQVDAEQRKMGTKLHPFVKGVIILTVSPVAIAVAVVFSVGALMYGTGQLLVGLGDIMMGGPLRKKAKKAWQARGVNTEGLDWVTVDESV